MAQITIQIPGLAELLTNFHTLPEKFRTEIGLEIQASGIQIAAQALALSPIKDGALRAGISYKKIDDVTAEVYSNVRYSAYLEAGTGNYVSIPAQPPEADAILALAKGLGIRQSNMYAHPYFFPAINAETPLLIERVQKILNDLPN